MKLLRYLNALYTSSSISVPCQVPLLLGYAGRVWSGGNENLESLGDFYMHFIENGWGGNWSYPGMSADVILNPLHTARGRAPRSIFVTRDVVTPLSRSCLICIRY